MFITSATNESVIMMGIEMKIKLSAENSNGSMSIIEQTVQPGAGSPLHICNKEDKIINVQSGSFDITIGNDIFTALPGDIAFIPKGTAHNFKNTDNIEGRLIITITPGGHEKFLKALKATIAEKGKDMQAMRKTATTYGVEIL